MVPLAFDPIGLFVLDAVVPLAFDPIGLFVLDAVVLFVPGLEELAFGIGGLASGLDEASKIVLVMPNLVPIL